MSPPATPWTELSITGAGWQQGIPVATGNPDDYYIDVLFEGTVFFNPGTTHTKMSLGSATVGTELSVAPTIWTELT